MSLQRFSVATFNLFNLQLPGLDMNPGQKVWTQAEFDRKVGWIGGQLAALDADIVGLQELWHADAMAQVLAASGLEATYDLLAVPATGTRIICGALVRKGLLRGDPRWVDKFPDATRLEESNPTDPQAPAISVIIPGFSRPVLNFQVALRDDGPQTEVFVTHFKSKLPTTITDEPWFDETFKPHQLALGAALSTIRRTAEATALRVLLTGVMKETKTPVIVLGDLNDGQHSNTVNILTEQPKYLVGDARGGVRQRAVHRADAAGAPRHPRRLLHPRAQ